MAHIYESDFLLIDFPESYSILLRFNFSDAFKTHLQDIIRHKLDQMIFLWGKSS